ncbi:hypothetical protein CDAR_27661 [Caerostris darwini]|uniref:Uncharacterized protein n=1 Tax=Caerostris darwini TaxID=1538125 RepID=A0AAV4SR20_9ARAC|nr:hypothetical protein CDAR_27661 [Caerostris darwini]
MLLPAPSRCHIPNSPFFPPQQCQSQNKNSPTRITHHKTTSAVIIKPSAGETVPYEWRRQMQLMTKTLVFLPCHHVTMTKRYCVPPTDVWVIVNDHPSKHHQVLHKRKNGKALFR